MRIEGAWGSLFHRNKDQVTNPVELAVLLVAGLRDFEADYRRRTRALQPDPRWPEPMVAVSEIRSAGWFSNTPEDCRVGVFANMIPLMSLEECKELVTQFVGEFSQQDHPWLREHPPSARWGPVELPSMVTPESSDFYQTLAACHQAYFDAPLRPRHLGGWGDMVLLGCQTSSYGPGGGGGDHSYNEYFELADLGPMLKTVGALTLRWAGIQH